MKWMLPLIAVLALSACKKEEKVTILSPVYNQTDRELSCDNQPAMVKECVDVEMCGKFGEDVMNYSFCHDECVAKVKQKCRKPKMPQQQPAPRITAPMPLVQTPTPSAVKPGAQMPPRAAPMQPMMPAPNMGPQPR